MPPDLVIFDCDGVLVDTEAANNAALQSLLNSFGTSLTYEEIVRGCKGKSNDVIAEMLHATFPGVFPSDIAHRIHVNEMIAMKTADLKPIPGAPEAVMAVREASIAYCVASNGEIVKMHETLGKTGLLPLFAGRLFSAEHVATGKPAPDLFLHAASAMETTPERCVVIEDSPTGVQAAVAAGMPVLGLAPPGDPEGLAAAGASVFQTMAEVPTLLGLA